MPGIVLSALLQVFTPQNSESFASSKIKPIIGGQEGAPVKSILEKFWKCNTALTVFGI